MSFPRSPPFQCSQCCLLAVPQLVVVSSRCIGDFESCGDGVSRLMLAITQTLSLSLPSRSGFISWLQLLI
ncbi:hypothetical protein PRUPE_1G016100 [Prunus persica]|uniref:Uncharacterized protein n=1 Tax=Prunus persica TaxID=3760 RepID=M5XNH3_PRUPE|nr:hypothetical protein PRUPE_1G016100 [Prunus persica]